MKQTEINGKNFLFPESWHEITVAQLIALRAMEQNAPLAKQICEALAILSGTKANEWFDMDADTDTHDTIFDLLAWTKQEIDWQKLPVPKVLTIGDRAIDIPQDLTLKTYGQVTVFESLVFPTVEKTGDLTDAIPVALAIYLQPLITGSKFDADKLGDTIADINKLRACEAFPVANFFLKKYLQSMLKKSEHFTAKQTQQSAAQESNASQDSET